MIHWPAAVKYDGDDALVPGSKKLGQVDGRDEKNGHNLGR